MKPPSALLIAGAILTGISLVQTTASADEYYGYDESGNIIEKRIDGEATRLNYNTSNQLLGLTSTTDSVSFGYDSAGALSAEFGNQEKVIYERGHHSRIRKVLQEEETVQFFYDHRGFPAGKMSNSVCIPWSWEGSQVCLVGSDVLDHEFAIVDHLGNDLMEQSVAGGVFGLGRTSYTGKIFDDDLNGFVFPYRTYRPDMIGWTESDPLGFPDGKNNYAYVEDPNSSIDPLGLEKWTHTFTTDFSIKWTAVGPGTPKVKHKDQYNYDSDVGEVGTAVEQVHGGVSGGLGGALKVVVGTEIAGSFSYAITPVINSNGKTENPHSDPAKSTTHTEWYYQGDSVEYNPIITLTVDAGVEGDVEVKATTGALPGGSVAGDIEAALNASGTWNNAYDKDLDSWQTTTREHEN